ncbi:MAG TPA: choice-of-anchor D domain-containing protein, partial [Candidatus Aquilonibacter sp.]|nr:choice-of-anchor D domain-containing protein [Candidatus Aquilonibacter sp.]
SDIDGVAGFSLGAASGYTSLAALVRFNQSGTIDVRNGANYTADSTIAYAAGSTYHLQMVINPAAHTYTVYVTPPGGSQTTIATNYAFRSEQASTSSLNNWALLSDVGTESVCNMTISSSSGSAPVSSPAISVQPTSMNFGNVNVGGNSTLTGTISSTGTAALSITAVTISGSGYKMSLQPVSVSAGSSASFTVTFTPTTAGSAAGTISITSNAAASPTTIALTGTGVQAEISASPSSVSFGTVADGTTDTLPITLKNGGNATLTFTQIAVSGTGFAQTGLSTSTTLAAGASTTFNATFDPSSAGAATGSIILTTNGAPSPLAISLSGTGQSSSYLLGASPASLSFGSQPDQTSQSQTATLTNNGNSNVVISGVTVKGAGFSASGVSSGTTLQPGQSVTLTVAFDPSSGGAVSGASVSIASNASNSPAVIALSGTGTHWVQLSWSPSSTSGVTYNVYRGTSSGAESSTPLNPSSISGTSYSDSQVTPGQTYYYTVKAVDSGGASAPSNEASAAIPNP